MNYKQQLAVVEGLGIPPDTQIRMDCPFCQNKNTLTVDTTSNNLGWYCFHASCLPEVELRRLQISECIRCSNVIKIRRTNSLRHSCYYVSLYSLLCPTIDSIFPFPKQYTTSLYTVTGSCSWYLVP